MLDDLKLVHNRDAQDALGLAEKQWEQLGFDPIIERDELDYAACSNIVYAGMGSSGLAGALVPVLGLIKPFEVVRGYDLPGYVDAHTVYIAASGSGNTEETLESLALAEAAGAKIVVMTGGGKLAAIARAKGYPLIILPTFPQPRFGAIANCKALAVILMKAKAMTGTPDEFVGAADFIQRESRAWLPTVPTKQNYAKQLALECIGKSVVMYSGPSLAAAAYKWKIAFNENAKQVAWVGQYPEFSHNEFMGWTKQPPSKPYSVIELLSELEHPRTQKRIELTRRLLSGLRPEPLNVQVAGTTPLEQLLWTLNLGDFVTIYTGLLNGVNPMPVELVEKFKKMMEE